VWITGSGNVVTQEFDLSGFKRVEVSYGFDVDIRQGDAFGVAVRVDGNVAEHLQVVTQGRTLKIGLKDRTYNMLDVTTSEAEVTMPQLTGLALSGASKCTVTGFESGRLSTWTCRAPVHCGATSWQGMPHSTSPAPALWT
jgi:hypothetical protein